MLISCEQMNSWTLQKQNNNNNKIYMMGITM